jgi:hypothetical protein
VADNISHELFSAGLGLTTLNFQAGKLQAQDYKRSFLAIQGYPFQNLG